MGEASLVASRVLMGDSLGFHILFVMMGLTFPILVSWFEWLGMTRKDPKLTAIAYFWSKIMAVLVITGVISGTIVAVQMSLVWPGILKFGGEVIGLPFLFETYAFLIEAVFLALYMYTWHRPRVTPFVHWLIGIGVIIGSTLSAYAITSVNAWMNLPSGFVVEDGKLTHIDVWQAMFSQTALVEFFHSMPGYYVAASLIVASLYAVKLLRVRYKDRLSVRYSYDWLVLRRLMIFATIMFCLSGITADITGKYLAKYEATKLAALELNYVSQTNAPLLIGGFPGDNNTVVGPRIEVPGALSLLSGNSTDTLIRGLEDVPPAEVPPLYVHTLFVIKMTLITAFLGLFVAYYGIKTLRPRWMTRTWFLLPLAFTGIAASAIVELGWMMTEIGRQPWAVRGYVTLEQAITRTHDITSFGYFFPLAYAVLFIVTVLAVKKITREPARAQRSN
jgi:cytochrome bd ubiquinol oxidase subunit I